jgi:subtilase family serine protease
VRCYAILRTDLPALSADDARAGRSIYGYSPSQIASAYKLPTYSGGKGQTVAIVDAYDDPSAEADLAVYRAQYSLPACTSANGCFRKVNQNGSAGSYPAKNASWAQEESLDVDMVSATCPNCKIVLVEANSVYTSQLDIAANTAVRLGADVVTNSYGGSENGPFDAAYDHPGHIIIASAGDQSYGAQQPCSFASVVCAGGTSLRPASNARGWEETAWRGSGSGCSAYVAKPSWQHDMLCKKRSEADVSADGDPNTGVAVYDSIPYQGYKGWLVFGGTSVSSPLLAGVFALARNSHSVNAAAGIWAHGHTAAFNDVVKGSNGSCAIFYLCHAGKGYDGPTGWGTPHGIAGF